MYGARSILMLSCVILSTLGSAEFYVDYDAGDDAQTGTSSATAWKHAPQPGSATRAALAPGDTVLFKGGVVYRESIDILDSGEPGKPITYKGDGWGKDKAIIDGSVVISTPWTPCTSAEQVLGNKDYQHIFSTDAPADYRFVSGTYEGHEFLYAAQDPTPTDQFHYDRIDQLRKLPLKDAAVAQTDSSIMDSRHFTQSDPSFYDGASLLIWHQPNVTRLYKITGFNPATHTITHEKLGGGVYNDRDTYYAIVNHPAFITGPGQYCHDSKAGRLYVWPRAGADPTKNVYSVTRGGAGITAAKQKKHVVIEGFIVQKFIFGIQTPDGGCEHVTIRNNEVRSLKANDKYGIQVSGTDMQVIGNRVTECQRAVGIVCAGKSILLRGNHVQRTSRQGIWFMGVDHGEIVGNTVVDISGTHANGISAYLFNKDILIAGNRVLKTGLALTYHGNGDKTPKAEGIYFVNNIIDGAVNCWGKNHWDVVVVNNTFLGSVSIGTETKGKQICVNNIIHGGGAGEVRHHNLFTALNWTQSAQYKWMLGDGEIDWSKKSREDVFLDLMKGDYHLRDGSPAISTGVNAMEYMPTALFPDYDFSKDIDGKSRAKDGVWDLGAHQTASRAVK